MADLATITATLQSTIDAESSNFETALTNRIQMQILKGHPVYELNDLTAAIATELEVYLPTWIAAQADLGRALFQSQE